MTRSKRPGSRNFNIGLFHEVHGNGNTPAVIIHHIMEKTGGFCGQPLEVDAGLKESVVDGFHMNDAGIYGEAMVSGGKGQTECLLICWFVRQDEASASMVNLTTNLPDSSGLRLR